MKGQNTRLKIGITGGRGVIGSILFNKLKEAGYRVTLFGGDICSKKDLQAWLDENVFDAIFHLAAMVATDEVNKNSLKAYSVNVGGTINLLEAILNAHIKPWIFYASSCHVYKSKSQPIVEDDPLDPVSLYGETKLMAEKICNEFAKSYDLQICSGRIFSFYHNTQKKSFLYPTVLNRLNTEDLSKPFFLHGANNIRDFLNAEEVVDIMIKLMIKKANGVVNIASGSGISIKDFVQRLSLQKLDIRADEKEVSYLVANVTKLNLILN